VTERARKVAKKIGVSDEQFEQAVINAKIEYETGVAPRTDFDDAAFWVRCANWVMIGLILCAIVYFLNRDYDDLATKLLLSLLPAEAKVLGIRLPAGKMPFGSYNAHPH
jgi:hypothetical protein